MSSYTDLLEFLESKALEDNQFCKNNGEIPRFLNIKEKLSIEPSTLRMLLTVGVCRLFNVLGDVRNSQPTKYLTYLFYDLMLYSSFKNFPMADVEVINDDDSAGGKDLDKVILSLLLYSDDIWVRVHPEHFTDRPEYYDTSVFPPKCGVLTGIDSDIDYYPVLTGELWHVLNVNYGNSDTKKIPTLIIPIRKFKNSSFSSCWKLNHETSVDFHYATFRDINIGLDFESQIDKLSPMGFNLLSRNDLCCDGKSNFIDWIMLYPSNSSVEWKNLRDKCGGFIDSSEAFRIYQVFSRIYWFAKLLCCK